MYTIDKGFATADRGGYRTVSQQHKLLDEVVCFIGGFEVYLGRVSVFVQTETHFFLFDGEGTVGDAGGTELGSKVIEGKDDA